MPNKKRANRSASRTIRINRAPVLTLWATIVAERMGFRRDEALTLGRAVAGLNAYTKGKSLGLYKPKPKDLAVRRRAMRHGEILHTELLHRAVSAVHTPDGLRALSKDRPIDPDSVQRYLESKFGAGLQVQVDSFEDFGVLHCDMEVCDFKQ